MARFVIANRFDGLGGRLINLLLSMSLARHLEAKLMIHWPNGPDLSGRSLDCLFTSPMTGPYGRTPAGCRIDWDDLARSDEIHSLRLIGNHDTLLQADADNHDAIALRNVNLRAITTLDRFTEAVVRHDCRALFDTLMPHRRVLDKVAGYGGLPRLPGSVGVHVRRGDLAGHGSAIHRERLVDLDTYFAALDAYEGRDIFLATDGTDVAARFHARYGPRLHMLEKGWLIGHSRRSCRDIRHALAEIILLSRCRSIVSGPSNFSRAAALIGDTDYRVLKADNGVEGWDAIKGNWGL